MRASAELSSGTLVSDRYWVQRTLGYGSCGCTYLVQDKEDSERPYVLKEFAPTDTRESVIKKSYSLFEQESQVLCKLKHPQIPQCFGSLEDNGRLFLVQEYIDGKTYCELLNERLERGEPFSEAEAIQWLKDLLPVLDYIHSNRIVHRDISPDNIMLPKGSDKPVLIDFGVVKQVMTQIGSHISTPPGSSLGGTLVGKAGYSPPEQLRLGQCYPNSDLYALAVTALVLLSGKHPSELCDGYSLKWQWRKYLKLNSYLGQIFDKMLAEVPKDRFRSARQVMAALEEMSLNKPAIDLDRDEEENELWSEENTWLDYSNFQSSSSVSRANRFPQGTNFQEYYTIIQNESGDSNRGIPQRRQNTLRRSRRRTSTLPMRLLALTCLISGSVVGGLAIGNLSPEIALVCQLFNNCANDEPLSASAKTQSDRAAAPTESTQVPTADEWRQASDRSNTPASPFVEVSQEASSDSPSSSNPPATDYQKELTQKVHEIQSQIAKLVEQRDKQKAELQGDREQKLQQTTQEEEQPQEVVSSGESNSAPQKEGERVSSLPHRSNPAPPKKTTAIAKKTPENPQAEADSSPSPSAQNSANKPQKPSQNSATKPQKPSQTPTNSSKNPTPTPKKNNPPAQTYQPGYWQPSARVDPKRPFRVNLINRTNEVIEYALTTNEFSPRQLASEESTVLTHVPLDANLLINAIQSSNSESAVSLQFDISVAKDNMVNVTIRRNGREQPGASTLNVDRSGAIYVF